MTHKITQIDAATQTVIERELNAEELAQKAKDEAQLKKENEIKEKLEAETAIKRTAAEAKLSALGLTSDDLKVLGLG
jgi:hypothetical protein